MATVGVDFDGVIHAYSDGWRDGTIYDGPLPGALESLHELRKQFAVFVHTSRDPQPVADWLCERDVPAVTLYDLRMREGLEFQLGPFWSRRDVVLVTGRKLPALAYIDDRAIRFVSWDQAMADLHDLYGKARR